jgi:PhnB protein
MQLIPCLVLNGTAKEAVAFYTQALDATVEMVMTFGEMPADPCQEPMPEAVKGLIAHAELKAGDHTLMLSDTFPGFPYQTGNNVNVTIVLDDVERAGKVFGALAEGGKVTMPLGKTFWSPAYGMLTDKFGVVWQISTAG